jgi:acyl-coenzyme A thioesterase PaaI-like protein
MNDSEPTNHSDASDRTDVAPVQTSWPELPCFGCGPANEEGLQLESYTVPDERALEATIQPAERFRVTPGVVYGGYLASVIDCNSMWTATTYASPADDGPPDSRPDDAYATAEITVEYHETTPMGVALDVTSRVVGEIGRSVQVETEVVANGALTVTGDVTAVRMEGML